VCGDADLVVHGGRAEPTGAVRLLDRTGDSAPGLPLSDVLDVDLAGLDGDVDDVPCGWRSRTATPGVRTTCAT